jgi:hypothetical protein
MKVRIAIAERRADVLRCQYFIAEIYNELYGITFSEDIYDLAARIEPYPNRYLMATAGGELVAALGLYTRDTYVERYGGVTDDEIRAVYRSTGVPDRYADATKREITKLVVKKGWSGLGLTHGIHEAAHSRSFMDAGADRPVVVMICARVSLIRHMLHPHGRIRSRFLAPFPRYPVHSDYCSEKDPMESHVSIPDLDAPEEVRSRSLPIELELPDRAGAEG